jgi:hypothetical protein
LHAFPIGDNFLCGRAGVERAASPINEAPSRRPSGLGGLPRTDLHFHGEGPGREGEWSVARERRPRVVPARARGYDATLKHDESAAHMLGRIERSAVKAEVRACRSACLLARELAQLLTVAPRVPEQKRRDALKAQVVAMDAAYAARPRRMSSASDGATAGGSSMSSSRMKADRSPPVAPPAKRRSTAMPPPPAKPPSTTNP